MSDILFIAPGFPPSVNGVGDYTYHLAKEFVRDGHSVRVITHTADHDDGMVEGIRLYRIAESWSVADCRAILKLLDAQPADLVILQYVPHGYHHQGLPFPLLVLTAGIKRRGIRLFTFFHEVYIDRIPYNLRRNIGSWLMRRLTRRIARQSDHVATSITHYRQLLTQLLPPEAPPVGVIPIASNVPEIDVSEDELQATRRSITGGTDVPIIAFFGARDVRLAFRGIETLIAEGLPLRVLLIGKNTADVPDALLPYVRRTGILPLNGISRYLQAADIFILPEPSHWGAQFKSGSLIAALRAGLPVLSCRGTVVRDDLLQDGEDILFTDFTDTPQLASDLRRLLTDPALRQRLGDGARSVAEAITWPATYQAYQAIIATHA